MISTKINNNDSVCLIESLTGQYKAAYGYAPNEPLKLIWRQLEQSFSTSLTSIINNKIQVLNPPTGTGKTHCLAEWCKHNISYASGHSILIVVRTKKQADELASQINSGSSTDTASASHGDSLISLNEAQDIPVLIITAAAYENLLVKRLGGSGVDTQSAKLLTFRGGSRQLTVIDEAFSFSKNWTADLEGLKQAYGHIPKDVADNYPLEMQFINEVISKLEDVKELKKIHFNRSNVEYDFDSLLTAMRSEQLDRNIIGEEDRSVRMKLLGRVQNALQLLSRISEGFAIVQAKGSKVIEVGSSISLLPAQLETNIIILDATAKSNPSYSLMASRVDLIDSPKGARVYSNLSLHISEGHSVGKDFLLKHHKRELNYLSESISQNMGEENSLLVICHKILLKKIKDHELFSDHVEVINWGAIDGKNDWKDVENITVFGLPYRNSFAAILEYFALQGEQSNQWLKSSGDRPKDRIRTLKRINRGYMVSSIIQALNRCQIRKSINTKGLCPETNIYILLAGGKEANFVIDEIKSQMPNLQIHHWDYGSAKDARKSSKYLQSVLDYCQDHKDDPKIHLKDMNEVLQIPLRTFRRIKETLNDNQSVLSRGLGDLRLVYRSSGHTQNLQQWLEPITSQQPSSSTQNNNIKVGASDNG